ncbi:MAG: hypothetical protein K2G90_00750 [Muribaculaceae bacterium]|nr:hypothetical protein [Muribaculaceae bacterium]
MKMKVETMKEKKFKNYSYDEVKAAEFAQKGGRYRLICNRKIDGKKCRCFVREFKLGDNLYWNVSYVIDGKIAEAYNGLVKAMYEIAHNLSLMLSSGEQQVVMWSY